MEVGGPQDPDVSASLGVQRHCVNRIALFAAPISVIHSGSGHAPAVSAIGTAANPFAVATSLALLVAGLWPDSGSS